MKQIVVLCHKVSTKQGKLIKGTIAEMTEEEALRILSVRPDAIEILGDVEVAKPKEVKRHVPSRKFNKAVPKG